MRFTSVLADAVMANVHEVSIHYTYEKLIEGSLAGATRSLLIDIQERIEFVKSGRLKGFYCFEPDLMEEEEYWEESDIFSDRKCLKDNKISVMLHIPGKGGEYRITLEWFASTKELSENPLTNLVQQRVESLKFSAIREYCSFLDWGYLALQ